MHSAYHPCLDVTVMLTALHLSHAYAAGPEPPGWVFEIAAVVRSQAKKPASFVVSFQTPVDYRSPAVS